MKQEYRKPLILVILLIVIIALPLFFLRFFIPEGEFYGYIIKDANILVFFSDFPSFWSSIKTQGEANSATRYLFNYLYDVELFFRKKLGIRPTPFRWNLWAGKPLLVSWNKSGDYIVSFKPNPLFHFFILTPFYKQKENTTTNLGKDGKIYYLWRGEELLISNENTLLQQSVLFSTKPINMGKNAAYIELGSKIKASFLLHTENNLYVDGKILSNRKIDNNVSTLLNLNKSDFSFSFSYYPLVNLLSDISLRNTIFSLIPPQTLYPIYVWLSVFKDTTLEKLYHKIRDKGILEKSIFFYSETSDKFSNLIPVFGLWFPYENNDIQYLLSKLDLGLTYYPHLWGSYQGYLIPIWGNALCLSLVYYEKGWLVCSQESLMSEVLESLREDKKNSETVPILTINLSQINEDIEKIFLWSARQELLMGINERDMSNLYSPWKQFLKEIGTFTFTIRPIEQREKTLFLIHGRFVNEN